MHNIWHVGATLEVSTEAYYAYTWICFQKNWNWKYKLEVANRKLDLTTLLPKGGFLNMCIQKKFVEKVKRMAYAKLYFHVLNQDFFVTVVLWQSEYCHIYFYMCATFLQVGQEQFSPSSPGWPPFMRVNPILDWSYRSATVLYVVSCYRFFQTLLWMSKQIKIWKQICSPH